MEIKKIFTNEAPMAVGPYSQAIDAGGMVFTAGQIPVDPETGKVPDTIEEQTRRVLSNVCAVLASAGVRKDSIVSVTVYLTNIADFSSVNLIYAEYFAEPYPARSCVQVAALPKGVNIMVSAIGVKTAVKDQ